MAERIGRPQRKMFRWCQVLASATDGGCCLTPRTLDSIARNGVALRHASPLSTPGPTASTCYWISSGFYIPLKAWAERISSCLVHYELLQAAIATMCSLAATNGRAC